MNDNRDIVCASDIAGVWQGPLRLATAIELRIVFHISRKADGTLTAVMDCPDQKTKGIPVNTVTLQNRNIKMDVIAVQGIFEGKFKNDEIDGKWKQAGQSFALMLKRKSKQVSESYSYENEPSENEMADSLRKKEVTIGKGEWSLPGTLLLPPGKGPFRSLILVHGSGPHDRDQTIGPNKPFRDLARGLASRGIAVLRYEKRTKYHAEKFATVKEITVNEETIQDGLEALSLLRNTSEINGKQIFILGHSLGGMLIPRIGMLDSDIAGFIILAGSAIPLEDAIIRQMNYIFSLDGSISENEKKHLDQIKEQVSRVKSPSLSPNTPAEVLLGLPAAYWLDLRGYNPPETAKSLKQPMLILQGQRDYQVTTEDFHGWKKSLSDREDVKFKTYQNLNHLFMKGRGKITPAEYMNPGHVSESVINDIADWINEKWEVGSGK